MNIEPQNQVNIYGLDNYMKKFINLYQSKNLPNKILLSGQKGNGKCTLAYHLINYVLSQDEEYKYDINNLSIDKSNKSFKLINNKTSPNFYLIDLVNEKKKIDITQIRNLIDNLNKSAFNEKPRFVLIDNIDSLSVNSVNSLLKIIEEPNDNINFIFLNHNKKILETLTSRCLKFMINLSNEESINISNQLLNNKVSDLINKDLLNYYISPGLIYELFKFGSENDIDLNGKAKGIYFLEITSDKGEMNKMIVLQ